MVFIDYDMCMQELKSSILDIISDFTQHFNSWFGLQKESIT